MPLQLKNGSHASVVLLLAGLIAVAPFSGEAHAQDLPTNIPDEDGESLSDRVRDQLTERHRAFLHRLFTGSRVGAAPTREATALSARVEGGLDLGRGSSIYGAAGVREFVLRAPVALRGPGGEEAFRREQRKTAVLTLTLGYALGLERLAGGSAFAKRSALEVSVESTIGDLNGVVLELSPQYEIPINQYWSLPVGMSVGSGVGEDLSRQARQVFFGFNIGVRLHHYAWYDRLK